MAAKNLAYVDVQHDALAVFDDVEQGIVPSENIWVSVYQIGEPSVHGKLRVSAKEGGGSEFECRDGVQVQRISKTNFEVSAAALGVQRRPVRFPRQISHPPYTKKSSVSPELNINAIDYSAKANQLVIGGPDGYCCVLDPSSPQSSALELKGHVGDVFDVKWFPSGEVVLTASADMSLRIFSSVTGVNPRVLRGHTRAITGIAILGVGKHVMSASKDATVRLWNVGSGQEERRWTLVDNRAVDGLVIIDNDDGRACLGASGRVALAASSDGTITVLDIDAESSEPICTAPPPTSAKLVSVAYSPALQAVVTGHSDGTISLRLLSALKEPSGSELKLIKRNEASIYSLAFAGTDLLVGTASGLPCCLSVTPDLDVQVKEEFAGWEAVGVETWAVTPDGAWCAGADGVLRRY